MSTYCFGNQNKIINVRGYHKKGKWQADQPCPLRRPTTPAPTGLRGVGASPTGSASTLRHAALAPGAMTGTLPNLMSISHCCLIRHLNNLWHSWPGLLSETLFSCFPSLRGSSTSLVSPVGASSLTRSFLLKVFRAPPGACSSVIYPMASSNAFGLRVPNAFTLFEMSILNSRVKKT